MQQYRTAASFVVTEKCNLACKYCFECYDRKAGAEMSEDVARAGVDFLFRQAIAAPDKRPVDITLFGGEPFLRPDLCDVIIQQAIKNRERYDWPVKAGIITNGTVMDDRIELMLYRWYRQLPFNIQISIDGNRQAQDLYRVKKDGSSSFDAVLKNYPRFKLIDNSLCLHGCINKQTMPLLYESYRYFVQDLHHRGAIWFMPIHAEDWDEEDVRIYDEQLEMIFLYETQKLGTVSSYTPVDKYLACGHSYAHPKYTCGAGTSYISFVGNGDIYPCHNFYFNEGHDAHREKMRLGNVLTSDPLSNTETLKMFEAATFEALGCKDCPNTACYRCLADNYTQNDDITKPTGYNGVRCQLSAIERKWQLAAVEWADKHCAPKPAQGKLDELLQANTGAILDLNKRVSKLESKKATK